MTDSGLDEKFRLTASFEGPGPSQLKVNDAGRAEMHAAYDEVVERTGVWAIARHSDDAVLEAQFYDGQADFSPRIGDTYWVFDEKELSIAQVHAAIDRFVDGDMEGLLAQYQYQRHAHNVNVEPPAPAEVEAAPDRTAVMRSPKVDMDGDRCIVSGTVKGLSSFGLPEDRHRFDVNRPVNVCHGLTPMSTAKISLGPGMSEPWFDSAYADFFIEPAIDLYRDPISCQLTQTRVPVEAMQAYVLNVIGEPIASHDQRASDAMAHDFGPGAAGEWYERTRLAMGIDDISREGIERWLAAEWAWVGITPERRPHPYAFAADIVNAFWVMPPSANVRAWRQQIRSRQQALHRNEITEADAATAIRADFESLDSYARAQVIWELARLAESPLRPDDRYDALVLIQNYRIQQATPALRRLEKRLQAQQAAPELPWVTWLAYTVDGHDGNADVDHSESDEPVQDRP